MIVEMKFDPTRPMQIGGQAVIEGVMMRAPGIIATAVRKVSGEIVVKKDPFRSLEERYPLFKLPVLRGAVGLIEMMIIGIRTLNYSAEVGMEHASKTDGKTAGTRPGTLETVKLGFTVAVSLAIGVVIFFITPLVLTTSFFSLDQKALWFNLITGGFRIVLFLAYLGLISMMKDIQRLFQYHGAEHKAVFAFESGGPLDVVNSARQSRFHPRCGTSFLLIVMFVAIVLFSIVDALLIRWFGEITLFTRVATHLPLIPLVGGLSYEVIKVSARRSSTPLGRIVVAPGLWLQRITTREPDESQLEVAIKALRCALNLETEAPTFSPGLPLTDHA